MIDYETALVVASVANEQVFLKAQDMGLKPDAFVDDSAAAVWHALCENFSAAAPHNSVELGMRMKELYPETVDSHSSWLSLASAEVGDSFDGADKWLEHVAERWKERRKVQALESVVALAADGATPSEISIALSDQLNRIEDSIKLEEQRVQQEIERITRQNAARIRGESGLIKTGIDFIDHQCGKIRSHEYIVVGARPAVGKSAFARELMMGIVRTQKQPIILFSLEMPTDEVILHLASTNCGVSVRNVEDDFPENQEKLNDEQERFASALGRFLHIRDDLAEMREIEHAIGLAMRRHKPAVVIIDYLQLIQASHLKVSREREVAYISRRLKLLANQHRVPMVVLCQLNRLSEQEDREPKLSDLRESGSLEQDADAVWFIHRPREPKMVGGIEERIFLQSKRRGGQVDRFNIGFIGRTTKFVFKPVKDNEHGETLQYE